MNDKSILPIVGQKYYYFDDGKIKLSRRLEVVIKEIIPFNKIDEDTLSEWKESVRLCYWLYNKETDYFIKGDLYTYNDCIEQITFVRTTDDRWFSIDEWGGVLDVGNLMNEFKYIKL